MSEWPTIPHSPGRRSGPLSKSYGQCSDVHDNCHGVEFLAAVRGTAARRPESLYGTLFESSNASFTFAVFPGSTVIGSGVGGLLAYIPRDDPDGGGDWASHLPVGS